MGECAGGRRHGRGEEVDLPRWGEDLHAWLEAHLRDFVQEVVETGLEFGQSCDDQAFRALVEVSRPYAEAFSCGPQCPLHVDDRTFVRSTQARLLRLRPLGWEEPYDAAFWVSAWSFFTERALEVLEISAQTPYALVVWKEELARELEQAMEEVPRLQGAGLPPTAGDWLGKWNLGSKEDRDRVLVRARGWLVRGEGLGIADRLACLLELDGPMANAAFLGLEDFSIGELDLSGSVSLLGLPPGLRVRGDLILEGCTGLRALPPGLKVGGSLMLRGCHSLVSLGEDPWVGQESREAVLDLRECPNWNRVDPKGARLPRRILLDPDSESWNRGTFAATPAALALLWEELIRLPG